GLPFSRRHPVVSGTFADCHGAFTALPAPAPSVGSAAGDMFHHRHRRTTMENIDSSITSASSKPLARRSFVQASAVGAATLAFGALSHARGRGKRFGAGFSPDYGPLSPKLDQVTGLPLLALPDGFEYHSYGWTGQTMADGRPTPPKHDGMAVVARRGHLLSLVRNHELSASDGNPALVS